MKPQEFRDAISPAVATAHRLKNPAPIAKVVAKVERVVARCQSNANARAKKLGVPGRLTLDDVRLAFLQGYGGGCPFTGETMRIPRIELDHRDPLTGGGDNTGSNIRLLSARGNRIKEGMTDEDAHRLFDCLLLMAPNSQASVTRRLMAKPQWR